MLGAPGGLIEDFALLSKLVLCGVSLTLIYLTDFSDENRAKLAISRDKETSKEKRWIYLTCRDKEGNNDAGSREVRIG